MFYKCSHHEFQETASLSGHRQGLPCEADGRHESMTKLSAIPEHLIWFECHCGHHSSVPVADLLIHMPDTTTVHEVTLSARCSKCGQLGDVKAIRIVFKGG